MTRALFSLFLLCASIVGCSEADLALVLDPGNYIGSADADKADLTSFICNKPGRVEYQAEGSRLEDLENGGYGVSIVYPYGEDITLEIWLDQPGFVGTENAIIQEGENVPLRDCQGGILPDRINTDSSGYVKICFREDQE